MAFTLSADVRIALFSVVCETTWVCTSPREPVRCTLCALLHLLLLLAYAYDDVQCALSRLTYICCYYTAFGDSFDTFDTIFSLLSPCTALLFFVFCFFFFGAPTTCCISASRSECISPSMYCFTVTCEVVVCFVDFTSPVTFFILLC